MNAALIFAACSRGERQVETQKMAGLPRTDSLMDLRSDSLDANGFPLNPYWLIQRINRTIADDRTMCGGFRGTGSLSMMTPSFGTPPCTRYVDSLTWDTRVRTCQLRGQGDVSYHGHINWFPVTYTGNIVFEGKSESSTGILGDKDYNFGLATPDNRGITGANDGLLHLELDRRETGKLWGSEWWSAFAKAIESGSNLPSKLVLGRRASVLGLFGLDGVHRDVSELHPVYAISIGSRPQDLTPAKPDEVWQVFARHSAKNEGYCSRRAHPLNGLRTDSLKLDIPWAQGANGVSMDSAKFFWRGAGTKFIGIQTDNHRLAFLFLINRNTRDLFHAEERSMIDGTVYLRWKGPLIAPRMSELSSMSTFQTRLLSNTDSNETRLAEATHRLSLAEQLLLASQLRRNTPLFAQPVAVDTGRQRVLEATSATLLSQWPHTPVRAWEDKATPIDPAIETEDSTIFSALCKSRKLQPSDQRLCDAYHIK
jgi:hypothetical protein